MGYSYSSNIQAVFPRRVTGVIAVADADSHADVTPAVTALERMASLPPVAAGSTSGLLGRPDAAFDHPRIGGR
jgi:hypothetical protein